MAKLDHACKNYVPRKGWSIVGDVMSFRPLTISAALYQAYATMRLKDMQPWVEQWMTTEMYVGVPGSGAIDAWYKVLLDIELMKVEAQRFCGAAVDSQKFSDQIVRDLVYKMASVAGMPKEVLAHTEDM